MADRHQQTPFPLRIKDPEVRSWVKSVAVREDRSQNWLINNLIEEAMRRDQQAATQK
ncbi:hypothetical protein [Bisbaumannia pacifica]|uniref:Toxin-antitoxin system HicB family antitoxin n=1 Tax=Bisbaumannia pacifica TaxID=77098 RepID=A0ABD4KYI0_9GAMM|nr:hypothetical protein [Halomonas pacifica]MBH8578806.1 hypothetical protein [Halomonas pacifica]